MRINYFILLFIYLVCTTGCKKTTGGSEDAQQCQRIHNATIYANTPLTIGQTLRFGTQEVDGYRLYSWIGPNNYTNQYPSDSITNVQLQNEGWYHLHLTNTAGCEKFDSVFVDVKLQQGTPSCNVATNTIQRSNTFGDTYSSMQKEIESNLSLKALVGHGSYCDATVYFHPVWRTKEPEDGIYYTTNTALYDQTDFNYNKLYIEVTSMSILWASHADQQVYVSHVNGKLQVRFCSLAMSGSNGNTYTTSASGNLVEQ